MQRPGTPSLRLVRKAGCHSVGRVSTEPLVAWDLYTDLYVGGYTAIKWSSGCVTPEERKEKEDGWFRTLMVL